VSPVTNVIRLHPTDEVVVACLNIRAGEPIAGEDCSAQDAVPSGHKLAVCSIRAGAQVHKYDQIIGVATRDIRPGQHVHEHNLGMLEPAADYELGAGMPVAEQLPDSERASFAGFRRDDGRVGTRNFLGILTSVNCSATVAQQIAREAERRGLLDTFSNVDGIVALTHGSGCGMAGGGEGHAILERVLAGYARHPNFAAVIIVGLGCEVNQIDGLVERAGLVTGERLHTFTIQDSGGTRASVERGVSLVNELLPSANAAQREPCPASALTLALQCGGSDGFSGISANPALGAAVDLLVRHGGTALLSETPEIYGAEHLLVRRAINADVARALIARVHWWEDYTRRHTAEMDNNPSPGNKAGGLTTILEKALGSAAKGGTTALTGVCGYAEPVPARGLVFMDSPGYDPASVTGQVAAGANVICFTTGRGSVFGFKPVPSIKIASNSDLYRRLGDDMDINAGRIVDGELDVAELGAEIFRTVLNTASGQSTRSELLGFGDAEFVPWQLGAVM
jgi:altronate hydrolase